MTDHFAAFGECMLEMTEIHSQQFQLNYAGDTYNTLYYFSQLAQRAASSHTVETYYLTALGKDKLSQEMVQTWQKQHILTDFVFRFDHKLPGLYLVEVDEHGERDFYYYRSQAAVRDFFQHVDIDTLSHQLQKLDYFYFSGISLAILPPKDRLKLIALIQQLKSQKTTIIFDGNYRARLWTSVPEAQQFYQRVLPLIDYALLTFTDEQSLFGDSDPSVSLSRLEQYSIREIILKQDAKPCWIMVDKHLQKIPPPQPLTPIDTTGAGDSFNAAYLFARLIKKQSVSEAALQAHQLAAQVIMSKGAIIPVDNIP